MTIAEARQIDALLRYWDGRADDEEELRQINVDAGNFANAEEADRRAREAVAAFNAIVDAVTIFGYRVKWENDVPHVVPDDAI